MLALLRFIIISFHANERAALCRGAVGVMYRSRGLAALDGRLWVSRQRR